MTITEFFGHTVIFFLLGGALRLGYELINHLF